MRNLPWALVLVSLFFVSVGCAGSSLKPLTGGAREPAAEFHVVPHAKDTRHLEVVVADAIHERGCSVSAGPEHLRPASARYLVTYEDRWSWDMRMYLKKIVIRVQDIQSGALLGESEMHQGSLAAMGDKYEDIIQEATRVLFKCGG